MEDGGRGNDDQYATAAEVKTVCVGKADEDGTGCDFARYLGDYFYDIGVISLDIFRRGPAWQRGQLHRTGVP